MVLLLVLTGMRLGEVLHLRWESVDLRFRTLRVEADPVTGWAPKTRHERAIPLGDSPALLSLLRVLKGQAGPSKYVIAGADPEKPRNFYRPAWDKLMKAAGAIGVAPKHLRSTWVTAMAHGRGGPNAPRVCTARGPRCRSCGAALRGSIIRPARKDRRAMARNCQRSGKSCKGGSRP